MSYSIDAGVKAIFFLALISVTYPVHTQAAGSKKAPAFPIQLRGIWQGGREPCKHPGNMDSDSRIEIHSNKIFGYEDSSELISILKISSNPTAWKVHSKLDLGDSYFVDEYLIYVLSGEHLTVIDDRALPFTYTSCH